MRMLHKTHTTRHPKHKLATPVVCNTGHSKSWAAQTDWNAPRGNSLSKQRKNISWFCPPTATNAGHLAPLGTRGTIQYGAWDGGSVFWLVWTLRLAEKNKTKFMSSAQNNGGHPIATPGKQIHRSASHSNGGLIVRGPKPEVTPWL